MPIFRSQHQARLLAHLFLHPSEEVTLSALAARLGVSSGALHAEVQRLIDAGLLLDRRVGRSRLIRANSSSRFARPLAELLNLSFGPPVVIAEEFSELSDVEQVIIFGSWARRDAGEIGREPRDVDVLVIGTPDRGEVYDAADRAQGRLQMPVNPTVRSSRAWQEESDALVLTAKQSPYLVVIPERDVA
jgi:DNA-binding transcriptional ArsR family regulator